LRSLQGTYPATVPGTRTVKITVSRTGLMGGFYDGVVGLASQRTLAG
jgi:hypothetical protein